MFITSKSKKGDTTAVVIFAKRPESTQKKKKKKSKVAEFKNKTKQPNKQNKTVLVTGKKKVAQVC